MLTTTVSKGDVRIKKTKPYSLRPWVAVSTIWGQGNCGVNLENKRTYGLRYDFVSNWSEWDFTYHEIALFVRKNNITLGGKYRRQLSQTEWTPYVSYFMPFKKKLPFSLYNEAEYRHNSVVKKRDYLRTRHIATVYTPESLQEKIYIRPYLAGDVFMDWDDVEYEKIRLNIGYFIYFKKATLRVYYIPWTKGIKEENWNDQHSVGASLIYKW